AMATEWLRQPPDRISSRAPWPTPWRLDMQWHAHLVWHKATWRRSLGKSAEPAQGSTAAGTFAYLEDMSAPKRRFFLRPRPGAAITRSRGPQVRVGLASTG